MTPHLSHASKVADPFHVVRVANRHMEGIRLRIQNETLGHRGRNVDPLYSVRKLLLMGRDRLDERGYEKFLEGLRRGDPEDLILEGWVAKECVRDVYDATTLEEASDLLDKAITIAKRGKIPELLTLANTLESWRTEILAHFNNGSSNGPTEGLNLLIKKVKRAGHGFRKFEHYRLRILLYAGGVNWPTEQQTPRLRQRVALLKPE